MTVRAKVRRDGPGEWSWETVDDHGVLVMGVVGSWAEAIREVTIELRQLVDLADLHAAAAAPGAVRRPPAAAGAWRRWLGL